jgi:hypothetical protein
VRDDLDELEEPLARAAARLRRLAAIAPSRAAVERTRLALLRAPNPTTPHAWPSLPRLSGVSRRPALALVLALMLLALGSTTALASGAALPDSPLYSVRNLGEELLVRVAGTSGQRATLYVGFASSRTHQLRQLTHDRGSAAPNVVVTLLHDISDRVRNANQQALKDGSSARAAVAEAEAQIGQQLTDVQQQGGYTGQEGESLADTLQTVQAGQSGPQGQSENGGQGQP